jgi:hypothetical protein
MRRMASMLILAVICTSAHSEQNPTRVQISGLGDLNVKASRPIGGYPTISFTKTEGGPSSSFRIGTGNQVFRITKEILDDDYPSLNYFLLDGPPEQSNVVLAIAMYAGGSDCEYAGTVIGQRNGRLVSLLPKQFFTNAEGGIYWGDLGGDLGFGFASWNFAWGPEGHADPHRYRIKLYAFDSQANETKLIFDRTTGHKYSSDDDALAEFGLKYENFLRSSSNFNC